MYYVLVCPSTVLLIVDVRMRDDRRSLSEQNMVQKPVAMEKEFTVVFHDAMLREIGLDFAST